MLLSVSISGQSLQRIGIAPTKFTLDQSEPQLIAQAYCKDENRLIPDEVEYDIILSPQDNARVTIEGIGAMSLKEAIVEKYIKATVTQFEVLFALGEKSRDKSIYIEILGETVLGQDPDDIQNLVFIDYESSKWNELLIKTLGNNPYKPRVFDGTFQEHVWNYNAEQIWNKVANEIGGEYVIWNNQIHFEYENLEGFHNIWEQLKSGLSLSKMENLECEIVGSELCYSKGDSYPFRIYASVKCMKRIEFTIGTDVTLEIKANGRIVKTNPNGIAKIESSDKSKSYCEIESLCMSKQGTTIELQEGCGITDLSFGSEVQIIAKSGNQSRELTF